MCDSYVLSQIAHKLKLNFIYDSMQLVNETTDSVRQTPLNEYEK